MKLRWSRYSGSRIKTEGWRTSVEIPPTRQYGPTSRRYGCVWEEPNSFYGYVELHLPGQVEDVELGPFASLEEAKAEVELRLLQKEVS